MKEIGELGYSELGRKYGVAHSTIKNWQKFYENRTDSQKDCHKRRRKADRPSHKQLLNEIADLGYCGTGKKYGVSDSAIRKWKKYYEKYGE